MPAGRTDTGVGDLGGRSWRRTTVEVAHLITVPQDFTVAVPVSVAVCVGRHGFPGSSPSGCSSPAPRSATASSFWPWARPTGRSDNPEASLDWPCLNLTAMVVVPLVAL